MKRARIALLFALTALSAACVSSREMTGGLKNLAGHVVLVGCIELAPALAPAEQDFSGVIGGKEYENAVLFALGDKIIEGEIGLGNLDDFVKQDMGKYFYIKQKYAEKLYLSSLSIQLSFSPQRSLRLPGPFLIEPSAPGAVLYLGRVRFHRDDYNAITKVEVVDEFDAVKAEAEKKFNTSVDLQRVRLKVPRKGD